MTLLSQVVAKVVSRKLLSIWASIAGLVVFNLRLAEIDPTLLDNASVLMVNVAIAGLGGFNSYRQAKVDEIEMALPLPPTEYKVVDRVTGNDDEMGFIPSMAPMGGSTPPKGDPPAGRAGAGLSDE